FTQILNPDSCVARGVTRQDRLNVRLATRIREAEFPLRIGLSKDGLNHRFQKGPARIVDRHNDADPRRTCEAMFPLPCKLGGPGFESVNPPSIFLRRGRFGEESGLGRRAIPSEASIEDPSDGGSCRTKAGANERPPSGMNRKGSIEPLLQTADQPIGP